MQFQFCSNGIQFFLNMVFVTSVIECFTIITSYFSGIHELHIHELHIHELHIHELHIQIMISSAFCIRIR